MHFVLTTVALLAILFFIDLMLKPIPKPPAANKDNYDPTKDTTTE